MSVWDAVAAGRSPRIYRTGQLIYLQGTVPECFYYLLSGTVRSFISTDDGEERILTVHRAGDIMGEASFFDGGPRVTSASALEECKVISFDGASFQAAIGRDPSLALPLLRDLGRTVRTLSAHVGSAALPAERRVARYLLSLPCGGDGSVFCTHEHIGQAVGLSRVTVSRTLGELARAGLIRPGYRSILLADRRALEALAYPSPARRQ